MLTIKIPDQEWFDERTQQFMKVNGATIALEHSLVSVSKWESKWHKAFLSNDNKTEEETLDYIRCMTLTKNVDPNVYYGIDQSSMNKISEYIQDPMTATWFSEEENRKTSNRETITSELIYYWMISLNIPVEFQRWHLNRLLTLIRVCSVKNTPPKKMNKRDIMNRNRALNEARRKKYNTTG